MYIDKQALFSDDQAITVDAESTNSIDLGDDESEIQALVEKGDIDVLAQVTTALTGGTSLCVQLQTSDSSTFSTATTLLQTAAIAAASLVAGYQFRLGKLPIGTLRYLRLYYDVVGTFSAGKVTGALVLDRQTNGI